MTPPCIQDTQFYNPYLTTLKLQLYKISFLGMGWNMSNLQMCVIFLKLKYFLIKNKIVLNQIRLNRVAWMFIRWVETV